MGDMAETFNAMRDATKQHRAAMLAKADTTGWTKHTEWHFSRVFNGKRMDWWPSGGKAMFDGRMVYGHRKVNTLIAKHISLPPNALAQADAACGVSPGAMG